jgi:hypothetical protein
MKKWQSLFYSKNLKQYRKTPFLVTGVTGVHDSKKNFCHTNPLTVLFHVAKIFDSTPVTKNGVFLYNNKISTWK